MVVETVVDDIPISIREVVDVQVGSNGANVAAGVRPVRYWGDFNS